MASSCRGVGATLFSEGASEKLSPTVPTDDGGDIASERSSERRHRFVALFFVLILAIPLAPIWGTSRIYTQDGGGHLAAARLIVDGWRDEGLGPTYFCCDLATPNVGAEMLMATLIVVGVDPLDAERCVASLAVVGLPLSAAALAASLGGTGVVAGIATFPWLLSRVFSSGLYSFLLAISLALVTLAVTVRSQERKIMQGDALVRERWLSTVAIGALLTCTWFAHFVGYFVAMLGLFVAIVMSPGRAGRIAMAALPSVLLSIPFLVRASEGTLRRGSGPLERLEQLLRVTLIERDAIGSVLFALFGVAMLFAVGRLMWRRSHDLTERRGDLAGGWLVTLVFAYFALPEGAGGAWLLHSRLPLAIGLLAAIWLSTQRSAGVVTAGVVATSILFAIVTSVGVARDWDRAERALEGVLPSVSFFGEGDLVWSFQLEPRGVLRDAAGEVARARWSLAGYFAGFDERVVDLNLYSAYFDYFAVRFRDGWRPGPPIPTVADVTRIDGKETPHSVDPHRVSLRRYAETTGRWPRFVLFLGDVNRQPQWFPEALATRNVEVARGLFDEVTTNRYELVHHVDGPMPCWLYRRDKLDAR